MELSLAQHLGSCAVYQKMVWNELRAQRTMLLGVIGTTGATMLTMLAYMLPKVLHL